MPACVYKLCSFIIFFLYKFSPSFGFFLPFLFLTRLQSIYAWSHTMKTENKNKLTKENKDAEQYCPYFIIRPQFKHPLLSFSYIHKYCKYYAILEMTFLDYYSWSWYIQKSYLQSVSRKKGALILQVLLDGNNLWSLIAFASCLQSCTYTKLCPLIIIHLVNAQKMISNQLLIRSNICTYLQFQTTDKTAQKSKIRK